MQSLGADIFTFNETHGDDTNPQSKMVIRCSETQVLKQNNGFSAIHTSSSQAPVTGFTKPGGNMDEVLGNLVGRRICFRVDDSYRRWCGFTIQGRDERNILILTVYNVSQDNSSGEDTLYTQQCAQYTNDYHAQSIITPIDRFIDPKLRFIADLGLLLKESSAKSQDIIITSDFNDVIRDSFNPLTKLIQEFDLRGVHAFNHGYNYDNATYFRGSHRLDYVFVSCRIIDHVVRCGYVPFKARLSTF